MRILIVNPFGIGDVLFSLPLVYALRQLHPKAYISFLCNRRTEEIVRVWKPLDYVSVFEKDEFRAAWKRSKKEGLLHLKKTIEQIRSEKIDVLVDLSLGWQIGFSATLAGIKKRIGFDFKNRGRFLTHRIPIQGFHTKPVHDYYLDLLPLMSLHKPSSVRHDFELPPGTEALSNRILGEKGISQNDKLAALIPGGGASWGPNAAYKQWPAPHFAEIADQICGKYGARILLLGDRQEQPLCEMVVRQSRSNPVTLTDIPSLIAVAGILKRCSFVVGNDSGLMHLAAALGTKTVTIFGPVDGAVYGPLPGNPGHRIVAKGLVCRPCYQKFRFPPCPWENACLKKLMPEEVLSAVGAVT